VQETFARALTRRRVVRGGGEVSYLRRILRNLLVDDHRRSGTRPAPARAADVTAFAECATVTDPLARMQSAAIFNAIEALPAHLRVVVTAIDVQGCSYRETAEAIGVPTGTVMSRLFRARARLAQTLAVGP
jgi:RNA polymerase sigma-70 factor (ECF subfamily)